MARFVLSLHTPPSDHDTTQRIVKFAHACLAQGHSIDAIFLYQDAIYHASTHFELASDELNLSSLWQQLADKNINLMLCVTAAEKRGLDMQNTGVFAVAGLAEFAMLASEADKWIQFK
ncbi:MAG: sulfurtransferase complex subunit TusD [Pseudoalteromonas tetraodonis]|uniref:sulfurtransferase complex subunit TusD n=2 Tax=Pseudoalteromonas TaxID=53246 RepID=UPI0004496581|nr:MULTISPECIES: sulfurtransferase complex subunit TusD [unclassified Pseudoalteromonas]EWS97592.1 tRNA 2-thiouridine-synthesizing protein [Pseudoalteromonas sp. SCSIO_11900]MCK8133615.1 sulfurtransferase complex subunit TusD [Pseudoalteromonas sp. 2CM28B]MDX1359780.1 sulfurtransferase complex subunit TusD [Pseudoalteromonas tetraodonis]MDX1728037.1 sulfurtransferase complex subunit TusD [Pseudoalteromonas tetraodonis]